MYVYETHLNIQLLPYGSVEVWRYDVTNVDLIVDSGYVLRHNHGSEMKGKLLSYDDFSRCTLLYLPKRRKF